MLCMSISRGLHKNMSDLSLTARGGDMFFFCVLRLLSLPGATFQSSWFRVLADRYSCSRVRLIGSECSPAYRQRRNLDLPDNIFDCLLTAMAKLQSDNRKTSFLFVGDDNVEGRRHKGGFCLLQRLCTVELHLTLYLHHKVKCSSTVTKSSAALHKVQCSSTGRW